VRGRKDAKIRASEDFYLILAPSIVLAVGLFLFNCVRSPLLVYRAEQEKVRQANARWKDVDDEKKAISAELERERDKSQPKLVGEINFYGVGTVPEFGSKTGIVVSATISNLGAPTIAKVWTLLVILPDGRQMTPLREMIPKTIVFYTHRGPRRFYQQDALYNKTLTPIPTGGAESGILLFVAPAGTTTQDIFQPGTKIVLGFYDVANKPYSCSHTSTGVQSEFQYVPGTRPPN